MGRIGLVRPAAEHEAQLRAYVAEHREAGESEIHGGALVETMPYGDWLRQLEANADERTVNPLWVVSSTFMAFCGEKLVGMVDIRHALNDFLRGYGGHIGYGVRPSERGKGYAGEMLREALAHCKALGLPKVMLACHRENGASAKTIERCGGVLEREFADADGKTVQVYWIELS